MWLLWDLSRRNFKEYPHWKMKFYTLCYCSDMCIWNEKSINFHFLWNSELRGMKNDIQDTKKKREKVCTKELTLNLRMMTSEHVKVLQVLRFCYFCFAFPCESSLGTNGILLDLGIWKAQSELEKKRISKSPYPSSHALLSKSWKYWVKMLIHILKKLISESEQGWIPLFAPR